MLGGTGDDIYIVDNSGDTITENSGEGTDLIQSSISYTASDIDVENITLTGSSNINANGNNAANIISNSGNNILKGFGSSDTIYANEGNDYIMAVMVMIIFMAVMVTTHWLVVMA